MDNKQRTPQQPSLRMPEGDSFGQPRRTGGATGSWDAPAGLRQQLSPAGGWFPGTRAVGQGFADEFGGAMNEPRTVGKVGKGLRAIVRGTAAAPLGLIEDVLEPWNRAGKAALGAVADVAQTAVTGQVPELAGAPPAPMPPAGPTKAATGPANPAGAPSGSTEVEPGIYKTLRPGQTTEFGDAASLDDQGFRNRGAISDQNMAAADALSARYAGSSLRGQAAPSGPNVFVGQDTGGYGLLDRDRLRERSLRMDADQYKPGSRGALKAFYERQTQGDRLRSTEQVEAAKDLTTRRGQDVDDTISLRNNATTRRGQDVSLAEKTVAGRIDSQKLAAENANKLRDDKRAAEAAFDQRVLGLVGTDKDGKPDAAAASRVRNTAVAMLGDRLAQARKLLKEEPNNKSAQAAIENIERNGIGAIDDDVLRSLMLNDKANMVAAEYDGWAINPWAGKAKNTNEPVGSLRLQKNMILPDQYATENGQLIPKRAVEANPDLRRLIVN